MSVGPAWAFTPSVAESPTLWNAPPPSGTSPLATTPTGPWNGLDVVFVTVIVYVDATPATTGGGTDTATIPVGEVTLSANAGGASSSEPGRPSAAASTAIAAARRRPRRGASQALMAASPPPGSARLRRDS